MAQAAQDTGRRRRRGSRVLRLRRWLAGFAILFTALLVGFIGYARYRARQAILNLPKAMGIDIRSETDGFTYSQTVKGRTIFTIHAAKAIQRKDGKTTLHNVSITLYGSPDSHRTDTIRGAEFEYDQPNGIVRALGDTLLDLAAPDAKSEAAANGKRITMQGRGFVFLQKLGVASTTEPLHFQYGASEGDAVGADYETDTGVLTLHHDVHVRSVEPGRAGHLDAASATLDRNTRTATLQQGKLTEGGDTLTAPRIVVNLRPPPDKDAGSLQHVFASGGAVLQSATGQRVSAPEMTAELSKDNLLTSAMLRGGVRMNDTDMDATAERADVHFNAGRADHLRLAGSAHVSQSSGDHGSRTLDANTIDSAIGQQRSGAAGTLHLALSDIHAEGAARLVVAQPVAGAAGPLQHTEVTASSITGQAAPGSTALQLRTVVASGGAALTQQDGRGGVSSSTGERIVATLAATGRAKSPQMALESVTQEGHVVLHETRPATPAQGLQPARAASQLEAHADRAEFAASTNLLTLTGSPRVTGDGLQIAAARILLHRDTGDASASGSVRGSVAQQGVASEPRPAQNRRDSTSTRSMETARRDSEPVQFAADSVELAHGSGLVTLHGDATASARLWSAAGSVEAPVIRADQRANTLHASGAGANTAAYAVRTVLAQAAVRPAPTASSQAAASTATSSSASATALTRVFSRELIYRGGSKSAPGTAEFLGSVRLLQGDDVITSDTATASLQSGTSDLLGGGVRSITADGHLRVVQGERIATGSHLIYTASDRKAVLTGIPGAPPTLRDPEQGTVTGAQLVLHMGTNASTLPNTSAFSPKAETRVEVLGGSAAPVHTEVLVPEKSAANTTGSVRPGRKARLNH